MPHSRLNPGQGDLQLGVGHQEQAACPPVGRRKRHRARGHAPPGDRAASAPGPQSTRKAAAAAANPGAAASTPADYGLGRRGRRRRSRARTCVAEERLGQRSPGCRLPTLAGGWTGAAAGCGKRAPPLPGALEQGEQAVFERHRQGADQHSCVVAAGEQWGTRAN